MNDANVIEAVLGSFRLVVPEMILGVTACVLLASIGMASYAALCWLLDIGSFRRRLKSAFAVLRTKRENFTMGPNK